MPFVFVLADLLKKFGNSVLCQLRMRRNLVPQVVLKGKSHHQRAGMKVEKLGSSFCASELPCFDM